MADEDGIAGPIRMDDLPWQDWSKGSRFALRTRVLSDTSKGAHVGVHMEELPPGKQSVPFHYHLREEEHLIALEGEAVLRLGERRYRFAAGDYVRFPAGQAAGHCLLNESDKPFRFITIGERDPADVCIYPDSNKMLVRATGELYDRAAVRDYWDGEEPGE